MRRHRVEFVQQASVGNFERIAQLQAAAFTPLVNAVTRNYAVAVIEVYKKDAVDKRFRLSKDLILPSPFRNLSNYPPPFRA